MKIKYHPVRHNKKPDPLAPLEYPGRPKSDPILIQITDAQLLMAATLDITQGLPPPLAVDLGWMDKFFSSVIDTTVTPCSLEHYSTISISWKRALSESLANAFAIAAAIYYEGYDNILPITLLKTAGDLPSWWPYSPGIFFARCVDEDVLMPDFLLSKISWDGLSFRFSSMEVKGRDRSIVGETYAAFEGIKKQSTNVKLVAGPNGKPPPKISRNILSLVAIRPNAQSFLTRAIVCRWFNQSDAPETQPPGALTVATLLNCALAIYRLFGVFVRLPVITPTRPPAHYVNIDDLLTRPSLRDALPRFGEMALIADTTHDSYKAVVSNATIALISKLESIYGSSAYDEQKLRACDREVEAFFAENSERLRAVPGAVLPIGVGIVEL